MKKIKTYLSIAYYYWRIPVHIIHTNATHLFIFHLIHDNLYWAHLLRIERKKEKKNLINVDYRVNTTFIIIIDIIGLMPYLYHAQCWMLMTRFYKANDHSFMHSLVLTMWCVVCTHTYCFQHIIRCANTDWFK